MSEELDKKAYQMFGVSNFDSLSEFGKRDVRMALGTTEGINMDHIDLARALAESQQREAALIKENEDLWEDNEELKLRLMEIEDEDSSSRRTKHR